MPRETLANSDPALLHRAAQVADRFVKATAKLDEVRAERDAMVAELRTAGWGYDRIAGALGMTKARVQQVAKENGL